MKYYRKKIAFVLILIMTCVFASGTALARHNSAHKLQCIKEAKRSYFVAIDRASMAFTQRKNSCRQNITTVDNHLRCMNRATARYRKDILDAKRRYQYTRWRCLKSPKLNRKDILNHRPNLQLRR